MAAIAEEPILTNISEMIDLAIGSPENGVVDFNMLQTVLHCLAQQLRVLGKNVELRGNMAVLPLGRIPESAQTIAVSEFFIDTGGTGKSDIETDHDSVLVVERKKRSSIPPPEPGRRTSPPAPGAPGTPSAAGAQGKPSTTGAPDKQSAPGGAATPTSGGGKTKKKSRKTATSESTAVVDSDSQDDTSSPTVTTTPQPAQSQSTPQQAPQQSTTQQAPQQSTPQQAAQQPTPQEGTQQSEQQQQQPPSASQSAMPPAPSAVPTQSFSKEKLSLVTLSKFNVLETAVQDLKERVYGTSPKNETILQEVRSQSNLKAITEMWTNMNVASRLDAAEEAIGKLSSLIEDVIGETTALQNQMHAMPPPGTESQPPLGAPGQTAAAKPLPSQPATPKPMPSQTAAAKPTPSQTTAPQAMPSQTAAAKPAPSQTAAAKPTPSQTAATAQPTVQLDHLATKNELEQVVFNMATKDELEQVVYQLATKDELGQMVGHLQNMRDDLVKLNETFSDAMKEVNPNFVPPAQASNMDIVIEAQVPPAVQQSTVSRMKPPSQEGVVTQVTSAQQYPGTLQTPPAPLPAQPVQSTIQAKTVPSSIQAQSVMQVQPAQLARLTERMAQVETELRKCCEGFKKTEGRFQTQFTSLQDQLEYMSKQMSFADQGGAGKLSPDLIKDLQALMKLFETVQSMQVQLKQVHDTALNLASEKEARQNHIDALLEQIELLKVIKLDREDMVEALADKADLRMLARKVSHDQFENACDDLSKGLEHALGKLNVQESLWQQALDDIQREIEQKLDKMELSPVKDFFNNKLKQLQENLRQMAALRREAEAAGTKKRLLRDVNCISCDANAVMKTEAAAPLPPKPLPANLSMKPYLSYELDAIRKNQANAIPQRNMHDWEHVQQQMQPNKPHKVRSETDKHLCNRYCGGSHTTTTPAQRVARLGHFMKQWGPEVLPLLSGYAAGDDGRLYKISTSEGANVGPGGAVEGATVCTPKSPAKKQDPSKSKPTKPVEIVAECRCLDPTAERPQQKH